MASTTVLNVLLLPCLFATIINNAQGGYVITTPRKWSSNGLAQVCVYLTDSESVFTGGSITITLNENKSASYRFITPKVITLVPGVSELCDKISVPVINKEQVYMKVQGKLGNVDVNYNKPVTIGKELHRIFVQTDKFLYKPGQKVQFRILSVTGPFLKISDTSYNNIWIESPSGSRLAQWRNHHNRDRLIHLEFQLTEEPEEGHYKIQVKQGKNTMFKTFKVEDFVLPRYEVTIKPPKYILATDEKFNFTVCAKYTYGAPVIGNINLKLDMSVDGRQLSRSSSWRRGHSIVVTSKTSPINGCKDIEITAEAIKVNSKGDYEYKMTATATVVEEGTDVELKGNSVTTNISRTAISFKNQGKEKYMKPALPFTGKIKAEFPDGSPAVNEPMHVCLGETCKNINTDGEGLLTFVIPSESQNTVQVIAVNYYGYYGRSGMKESSHKYYPRNLMYSPSNASLIIRPPVGSLSCTGEPSDITLPIMFATTTNQTKATLHIQVVSRGQIQFIKNEEVEFIAGDLPIEEDSLLTALKPPSLGAIKGLLNVNLQLPATVSPKAKIIVWYKRDDEEIVADTQEVEMQKCLSNDVGLSWSKLKVQPGEEATLTLSAEPKSICSLGVVDKSVELLSSVKNDLTIDRVFDIVESAMIDENENSQSDDKKFCEKKFEKPEFWVRRTYSSDFSDALKMFEISGLYILSDLTVETRPCKKEDTSPVPELTYHSAPNARSGSHLRHGGRGSSPHMMMKHVDLMSSAGDLSESIHVDEPFPITEQTVQERSYFPETWLWDINLVTSGKYEQQLTLPDTITEWVGKAVCVHPEQGLGLSPRAAIITFTTSFVDLTVPPTVKRGELLPVKISVFNYEKQDLPVRIILKPSEEYEIIPEFGKQPSEAGVRSSCVPSQDKTVHTIKIRPTVLGDVNITVAANIDEVFPQICGSEYVVSKSFSDLLIKPIKVEAEGFPHEKTWTKYICTKDIEENNDFLEQWKVEAPSFPAIVPDSARGWVTVVGDLLGPTLENLGSLVKMPYGCGEQNMLNFAPNIFILQYLDASNQTTEEIAKKSIDYMKNGYQQELKYRHEDGSFSAFGKRDASGSTWLTAFVLKSFAQARQFIEVDEDDLQRSQVWLKQRQQKNGCYESVGKVFQKGMKGGIAGSGSPIPLTAYVLISLLEAGEPSSSWRISAAASCLRSDNSKDPYTQALKAYALSLANLPEAQSAVDTLLSMASEDSSNMFWEVSTTVGKSKSVAVETAGYAILAMTTLDSEKYIMKSNKIVKWISSQRNGQGGFISTQDTVVALQAMASFEASQNQGALDMIVSIQAENVDTTFTINEKNKLLQHMAPLPSIPTSISLDMAGTGCALLQAVLRYNIPEPEPSEAFKMSVSTETEPDKKCNTKRIKTCASYLLPDGKSNMAVIEVKLISGYIPEKADLKQIVGSGRSLIKRYEVDGNLVTFYIDEFTSEFICVSFRVIREIDVEDAKPGTVQVYDYYQTEFSVNKKYTLPTNDECLPIIEAN